MILAVLLAGGIVVPFGCWIAVAVLGYRIASSLAAGGFGFITWMRAAALSCAAIDLSIGVLLCYKFVRLRQYVCRCASS